MSAEPEKLDDASSPAASLFSKAVELAKADADAAYRLMVATLHADPKHAGAWYHLSTMLFAGRKFQAALSAMQRCHQFRPDEPRVLTNLGWYSYVCGDHEAGLKYLKRATELAPELHLAWANLSQVYIALDDFDNAVKCAEKGVALGMGEPLPMMCLAFANLFQGKLLEGLKQYQARFNFKLPHFLAYPYKRWDGGKVGTLFIQAEQGIGDTISVLRFIPEVCSRAEKVILFVNKEIHGLTEAMNLPNLEVCPIPATIPVADAWTPIMSLPMVLGYDTPDLEKFKPPYLPRPAALPLPDVGQKRIGIVWGGTPENDLDRWRSVPAHEFLVLASIPGCTLHSLQMGPAKEQFIEHGLYGVVEDMSSRINTMTDTARIMESLDLIVTVDTSVAHLASALGHPTIVVRNKRASDWRWGRFEGKTSKWYPATVIAERQYEETWADTMARVVVEARKILGDKNG